MAIEAKIGGQDGRCATSVSAPRTSDEEAQLSTTRHRTTGVSPAFQFYPKDFLSSTKVQRMSLAEVGAYTLLLSYCWLDGSLPNDHHQIARLLSLPHRQWMRMWAGILSECFVEKSGRLVNARLDAERRKQAEYRAKQSVNGTKGGRPRKNQSLESGLSEPQPDKSFSSPSPISDLQSPSAKNGQTPTIDVLADRLLKAYPKQGFCNLHFAAAALSEAFNGNPAPEFDALLARLEGHKRSAKWAEQGGKFIPRLDRYLTSGTHLQVMAPVVSAEDPFKAFAEGR